MNISFSFILILNIVILDPNLQKTIIEEAVYSLIKSRFTGGIPSISPTSWTRSFIFYKILRSTSRPVAWSLLPPYLFYSQKVWQKRPKSCLPSTGRTALSKHKSYFSLFIPILLEPEHKPFDARKKA